MCLGARSLLTKGTVLFFIQETRIGKDVNALRKWEGKIGERAKKLVKKWKELLPAGSSSALHQTSSGYPQSETQGIVGFVPSL